MTPIEQKFWDAAAAEATALGLYLHPQLLMSIDEAMAAFEREHAACLMLASQVRWGNFTVDFVVLGRQANGTLAVVVECDGHDFHERTKEQAQRDRSRDRYFVKQCVPVLRFTGSELWSNADRCVKDVTTCMHKHDAMVSHQQLRPRPAFVTSRMAEVLSNPLLDETAHSVVLIASDAADDSGIGRVSFEFLKQECGVSEGDLKGLSFDLAPYVSMRSIDTHGRIVFRFRRDDARGPQ